MIPNSNNNLFSTNIIFFKAIESLEERVRALTEQLESQYELHKSSASRARKAESELDELHERLRSAEGEIAAGDVLRDGFRVDKEKVSYTLFLRTKKMNMLLLLN